MKKALSIFLVFAALILAVSCSSTANKVVEAKASSYSVVTDTFTYTYDVLADGIQAACGYDIPYTENAPQVAAANGEIRIYYMSSEHMKIDNGDFADRWGDCEFVVLPDGQTMLIDSAKGAYIPYVVSNLKKLGVTTIDYYVQSHLHNDHYGAMLSTSNGIMENFTVKNIIWADCAHTQSIADKFKAKCKQFGITPIVLLRGDTLEIGEVHVDVFNPKQESRGNYNFSGADEVMNNESLGIILTFGNFKALFSGDMYVYAEEDTIKAYTDDPSIFEGVTVVKTNHHGRTTSNCRQWAEFIQPVIAVTTRGEGIDLDTYKNYARYGAHCFGDHPDGYVRIVSDGKNYVTTTCSRTREMSTYKTLDTMAATIRPDLWPAN
ncbi:MAG: MBL fold metallo-hydrolase [Sphaerochaetaceae bacterium]|nr:MBL fold metallo-hydrolase [Sphaerochaetaceae bacterium]